MEWLAVIQWWIILELIGLAALPLCTYIFRDLDGKGLVLSRILGMVLVTYLTWILASMGLTYNLFLIVFALVVIVCLSMVAIYFHKWDVDLKELLRMELLFTAAFLVFVMVRGFSPEIYWSGGEKFMDMSFINMILRTTSFPPMDPWMAGEPMQYYYFGYLVIANLIKLSFVPPAIGFNLAVATLFALSATAAYGLGKDLTGSDRFGTITMAFVTIFGNLAGFVQLLVILFIPRYYSIFNIPDADVWTRLTTYYYWPTSRVIPDTITEFPYFSFLHGDLHAHMISMAFQLLMIGLLLGLVRGPAYNIPLLGAITLVLGFMFPLNSWEYPTYAIFFVMALIAWRIRATGGSGIRTRILSIPRAELIKTVGAGAAVGILSIALYLPYHLASTEPHYIRFVMSGQTPLFFYLGVYGIMLFFIAIYTITRFSDSYYLDMKIVLAVLFVMVVTAYLTHIQVLIIVLPLVLMSLYLVIKEENPTIQFVSLLILIGALLSLFVELFYIQDSLGITHPKYIRLNTVFKIYLQNWIVWGLAAGVSCYHLWHRREMNKGFILLTVFLLLAALTYPVLATLSRTDRLAGQTTLDGSAYIKDQHPDEFDAIIWLNNLNGTPVVLQSPGQLYQLNNHVTAFTGLPTVMGWGGHEKNWRHDQEAIDERWNDAGTVYTSTDVDTVLAILEKYQVQYIYVGGVEKERYGDDRMVFEKYPERFEPVYSNPGVHIYRVGET